MEMEITCPVCNTVSKGRFCEHCGFELHVLPSDVSEEILSYEKERAERYKSIVEKQEDFLKKEKEMTSRIEAQDQELATLSQRANQLQGTVEQQKEQIDRALGKEKELSSRIEAKDSELAALTRQAGELQATVERQKAQIDATAGEKPLGFLVQIQRERVTSIYGLFEGTNSFGYAKSQGRHQQVICNADVADEHFTVRVVTATDSRGRARTKYYVAPKDGRIYRSSNRANIISSEVEFEMNEYVFIDDVKFNLVANK